MKTKKVFLKQIRPHKNGFRIGRHLVKLGVAQEFELNEKELKELDMDGPKAWIKKVSKKEMDVVPRSNQENKERMGLINSFGDRVELTGEETIKELKDIKNELAMFDALVETCKEKEIEVSDDDTVSTLEQKLSEV